MAANIENIKNEFQRIKSLGFVKSKRPNNIDGGIGNTFEDYLGVKENNFKDHDFDGFEVKSQRALTSSYISLFSKSPTEPKGANRFLKDTFGRGDAHFPDLKSLHTSIFAHRWNSLYDTYKLILKTDRANERLNLFVTDNLDSLLSNEVYWSFEHLKKASNKMSALFTVFAETKKELDGEYFHFNKAIVYQNFNFDKFVTALEQGFIMFDIRIGVYKTGKYIGKPHDHGSGFRIKGENIYKLFEEVIEVE